MPKRKITVLVLDDDDDNAAVLDAAIGTWGFDVRIARSCAEATTILTSDPVDAIVTDFALGDGNAVDLISSLGANRPKVAVLVTGYGSPEHQENSRAAGFDAHLVKPIDLGQLSRILRSALADLAAARPDSTPPEAP